MSDNFLPIFDKAAFSQRLQTKTLILFIITVGILLRTLCFIGYGLGDDDIYASSSLYLLDHGLLSLQYGPNYRYGVHLPIAIGFMAVGVNELTFVAFPFLCSIAQILVIYKIADFFCGSVTALIAALIAAVSPFDMSFASTMTIDIPCTFLMTLSFYLFIKALIQEKILIRLSMFSVSILLIVWAYFIKFPSLILLIPNFLYLVFHSRCIKNSMFYFIGIVLTFVFLMTVDYYMTGDFLNYYHLALRDASSAVLYSGAKWDYFTWMFGMYTDSTRLFGYLFYYAAASIILFGFTGRSTLFLSLWLIAIICFFQFMPLASDTLNGYTVSPRFFRYTYGFIPPAILLIAVAIRKIQNFSWILAFLMLTILISNSIFHGFSLYRLYDRSYEDRKFVAEYMLNLNDKPIITNVWFILATDFFSGFSKRSQTIEFIDKLNIQRDIVEQADIKGKFEFFDSLRNCYLITGGTGGHETWVKTALLLDNYHTPDYWKLMVEKPSRSGTEPVRIYSIN